MKAVSPLELGVFVALSRAVGVRSLYPADHPSVETACGKVVAAVERCFEASVEDAASLLSIEGEVFLGETPLRGDNLHLPPLLRCMRRRGIQGVTVGRGLGGGGTARLLAALVGASDLLRDDGFELSRVKIAATVADGSAPDDAAAGAGGGGVLREELLDRAEDAFAALGSDRGAALGRLDEVVWQLVEGVAATTRSFLLLSPVTTGKSAFFVHSVHVSLLAISQARSLGIEGDTLHQIGLAAMLHDIGKLSLPAALRERRGRLSRREWEQMKLHPELGAAWLATIDGPPPLAALVAYEHHLRWDGGPSFPRPASPRRPNLASQITAVADTWDTIVSQRHPAPGSGRDAALEVWQERAGTWLDPFLVGNFVLLLGEVEAGPDLPPSDGHAGSNRP